MTRIKTTVYLNAADYRKLKSLATDTGRHAAELVREAVAEYAARAKEREWPKSFGMGYSGDPEFAANYEDALDGFGEEGLESAPRPREPGGASDRSWTATSGKGR